MDDRHEGRGKRATSLGELLPGGLGDGLPRPLVESFPIPLTTLGELFP